MDGWSETRFAFVHEAVERQASLQPQAPALVHGERVVTYAELNSRANQVARFLVSEGVGPNDLVGICLRRSTEMIIGLLGVLKAGGAYLPLDPDYPADRLHYMLQDAAPQIVLTHEQLMASLPTSGSTLIDLNRKLRDIEQCVDENISPTEIGLTSESLIYVIYTSGSTGKPKGTEMPHRSMSNLIEWHKHAFDTGVRQRVLQFAALSFDVAFQEIFTTLCMGDTLIIVDEWIRRDAEAMLDLLHHSGVERLFVPPMMLQVLAEAWRNQDPAALRLRDVIAAGEQLRVSPEIGELFVQLPGCRLHNHYGPTETHVVTALTLDGDARGWPVLPTIGRPIANATIRILDENRQPVPDGETGEIYIGGLPVAKGYRHRTELTEQRFVAFACGSESGGTYYKSGDLGRWREDGNLEYLGRNDDQVKIRGYRVELGDIESQLAHHAQVKEAAVIAREDVLGRRQLVAYFTSRGDVAPSGEDLRLHLAALLPEHMIPAAFVSVSRFPQNPNGKLDRRALPPPPQSSFITREYEPPCSQAERLLARAWQELLGLDQVGRQDNFFELGGHSLMIPRMLESLRQVGLTTDAQMIYAHPKLASLGAVLTPVASVVKAPPNLIAPDIAEISPGLLPLVDLSSSQIGRVVDATSGGAANVQDIYPLVPLQEGILFHHLFSTQDSDPYVLPILLRAASRQSLEALILAIRHVINRHDVLRTAVHWDGLPQPVQVVYRAVQLPIREIELDPDRDTREQLEELLKPEQQNIPLNTAPLMRLQIARDNQPDAWYAILQLHHIVCDHIALESFIAEVIACVEERGRELPAVVPYREHVAQTLARARSASDDEFFRRKLGDISEPTILFDLLNVHGDGARIDKAESSIQADEARRIRAQARRRNVSPATLFHAAWGLVVSRLSGRDDVVFGSLMSGRLQGTAGAHSMLGLFINTLPVRLRLADLSAEQFVMHTQSELADLMGHEQASLAGAQRCSAVPASVPLFNTLLNFLHGTKDLGTVKGASGIEVLEVREWTNYPIALSIEDQGDRFLLMSQSDRLIDPKRLLGYITTAINSLVDVLIQAPHAPATSIPVLPQSELLQVTRHFNATATEFPRNACVHELFEQQVSRTPDAVAVVSEETSLTYKELDSRANQLAHYLISRGVRPAEFVPLLMPRGLDMIVAQLAVLKCGAAYVPVDPSLPVTRQAFMIGDCRAKRVLSSDQVEGGLGMESVERINLRAASGAITKSPAIEPCVATSPMSPAYIMYTSGSTGLPKGVVIPHQAISRLIFNSAYSDIRPTDCVSHCSNPAFDATTFEIWAPLLNGAKLVVVSREALMDVQQLSEVIRQQGVTILFLTTGLFTQYADALTAITGQLRYLITGGDVAQPDALWKIMRDGPPKHLLNAYGPTECTTLATVYEVAGLAANSNHVPIGKPISNTQIYILDIHRQPVAVGVPGEIYIGGAGVALGYLNRPELTADRFVADPFTSDFGARLYRSGDLGRWKPEGNIEFLGRNDQQVKLRGFRIELGEIEAHLARHCAVKEAIVLARNDAPGGKRLVAYLTARAGMDIETAELRDHLRAALPDYMVPSAFVTLERLPLTSNGKVDRRALPEPDLQDAQLRPYRAPQGHVEERLAAIWQELLRVERIGRADHFFDLGGHSLVATQVAVRIRSELSVRCPVKLLFEHPTLEDLAARVAALRRVQLAEEIEAGGEEIESLLSSVRSMSDARVQQLMQQLTAVGRS